MTSQNNDAASQRTQATEKLISDTLRDVEQTLRKRLGMDAGPYPWVNRDIAANALLHGARQVRGLAGTVANPDTCADLLEDMAFEVRRGTLPIRAMCTWCNGTGSAPDPQVPDANQCQDCRGTGVGEPPVDLLTRGAATEGGTR